MNSLIRELWTDATRDEWGSLLENKSFEIVDDEPFEVRSVGSRWAYKLKRNIDETTKPKVRLAIKGFQQLPGIGYAETYASVSKRSTFRFPLSISTNCGWEVHHMDVVTASLNLVIAITTSI